VTKPAAAGNKHWYGEWPHADQIDCVYYMGDNKHAETITMMENYVRTELTVREEAAHTKALVDFFQAESLTPSVKSKTPEAAENGDSGIVSGDREQLSEPVGRPKSAEREAIQKVAEQTGKSETTVKQAMSIDDLDDSGWDAAEEAGLDDNKTVLAEAAKKETPEEQVEVIEKAAEKKAEAKEPDKRPAGKRAGKKSDRGHDLYPTVPEAVYALLSVETFSDEIWEPAAGRGHIAKILREDNNTVGCSYIKEIMANLETEHNTVARRLTIADQETSEDEEFPVNPRSRQLQPQARIQFKYFE
jgi:hypothetical protein